MRLSHAKAVQPAVALVGTVVVVDSFAGTGVGHIDLLD